MKKITIDEIYDTIDILRDKLEEYEDAQDDEISLKANKLIDTRIELVHLLDDINELIKDKSTMDLKEIYRRVALIYEVTL